MSVYVQKMSERYLNVCGTCRELYSTYLEVFRTCQNISNLFWGLILILMFLAKTSEQGSISPPNYSKFEHNCWYIDLYIKHFSQIYRSRSRTCMNVSRTNLEHIWMCFDHVYKYLEDVWKWLYYVWKCNLSYKKNSSFSEMFN